MKNFRFKKKITAVALLLTFAACQRESELAKITTPDGPVNASPVALPYVMPDALMNVSPNSLKVADNESFYGIYTSSAQWGTCAVQTANTRRTASGSYIKLLTDAEKDLVGNDIDFRIELYAGYDE